LQRLKRLARFKTSGLIPAVSQNRSAAMSEEARLLEVVKRLQKVRRELRLALELVDEFPIPARAREILRAALDKSMY